ncbi:uncharacterized protein LOC143863422 [Tasmannia lanceolata]|uniref:uncharacterized protein LOC143863422 n=1 Tax=Tasmannia lanceolata TaxID=3420 RepID=UPI004062B58F
MASNMLQPQLPQFNGKNYNQWSIQMKVLYGSQDLWDIVENGVEEPEDQATLTPQQLNELKDNRKEDKKALFFIYQAVDEVIFERISSVTSAKEAWDTLYTSYKGEDKVKLVRLQTLRCEFDALRMKDSESVEDFYNRVISLVNQLRVNGEYIQDRRIVEKILRRLTRKFEYIVVAIEESKDLASLSLEKKEEEEDEGILFVEEGEMLEEESKKMKKTKVVILQEEEGEEDLYPKFNVIIARNMFIPWMAFDETWYLDSGCSNHMTGNKCVFVNLDESLPSEVRTGDDKWLSVRGSGDILVQTKNGIKHISNVFYVPGLKHNLLSVGQLLMKGHDVHFKEDVCEIKDKNHVLIAKVRMTQNKMFPPEFQSEGLPCFNTIVKDMSWLWHLHYGHLSFSTLSLMNKKHMVRGMPNIDRQD